MQDFELKFDPKTIEHLGVRMYSTLPPALAELISNSYDADASKVEINLNERNAKPTSIVVKDNGHGMTALDIQEKFLVIGRNRRSDIGDNPSQKFGRLATGKKGLGKLALFGLAEIVTVDSICSGKRSRFTMNWHELLKTESGEPYRPEAELIDERTEQPDGTVIKLSSLKRKSSFDIESVADNLSRIFIVDDTFEIKIYGPNENVVILDNDRRYKDMDVQFTWDDSSIELSEIELVVEDDESLRKEKLKDIEDLQHFLSLKLNFSTSCKPLTPASGLRGVSLFSRGKLVNAPEFFSESTSSHFFTYLTGVIEADFIDLLDEDVISTNRQSINWDHPQMQRFRSFLAEIIKIVNKSWREKRKEAKEDEITNSTGIDTEKWFSTLPEDIKKSAEEIVGDLNTEEGLESSSKIVKALHNIIPEYPLLHWRHLHSTIRERIESYYTNQQFGEAADQGVRIYMEHLRNLSGLNVDGTDLTGKCFGWKKNESQPLLAVADLESETGMNIQKGQEAMSRGVVSGFWNPVHHQPIDTAVPGTFSELDCLNILSLVSYLCQRVEHLDSK